MQRRGFLHSAMTTAAVPGTGAAPTGRDPASETFRRAILAADPKLSKFNPLPRILCHDDFDDGINGWCELVSNHAGDLDTLRPVMKDLRPAQLSNCTFFDIGTHGSVNGTYALKLATRPKRFHTAVAIKRLTYARPGLVQLEAYFTFKAEQTFGRKGTREFDGNVAPSELDFGDFAVANDICEGEAGIRYHGVLRYQNTDRDGKPTQKWVYATTGETTTRQHRRGETLQSEDLHVRAVTDWKDVPGGHQPLCFNETATKINWHYMRWLLDTSTRRNVELQVNELTMDLRDVPVPVYPERYRALNHLLNFYFDVRTVSDVRNFLYLDSVLLSVDW